MKKKEEITEGSRTELLELANELERIAAWSRNIALWATPRELSRMFYRDWDNRAADSFVRIRKRIGLVRHILGIERD
jgi:hypothetical protein